MRWLWRKLKERGQPCCRYCEYPLRRHETSEGACDSCLQAFSWPTSLTRVEKNWDGPLDIPRLGASRDFQQQLKKAKNAREVR